MANGNFEGFVLTADGEALLAKVEAGLCSLDITEVQYGSGSASDTSVSALRAYTALLSYEMSTTIQSYNIPETEPNKAVIRTVMTNEGLASPFLLFEVGLMADDPDEGTILFCYENCGTPHNAVIPADGGGSPFRQIVDFNIVTTTPDRITIIQATLDATMATLQDLEDHTDATNVHEASSTGTPSRIVMLDENGNAEVAEPTSNNHIARLIDITTAITTAIANLVDSSPGTLDTLNEIAAALNDDPNAFATLMASIAQKLDTSTYTTHAADNEAHGAVSTPTAGQIALRDLNGRLAAVAGSNSQDCVVMGQFSFSAATGYTYLPNGLIIQWGTTTTGSNTWVTRSFPLTFPNAALAIVGSPSSGTYAGETGITLDILTTSTFRAIGQDHAFTVDYIVIGY